MNDKCGRRFFKTGAVVLLILGLVHSISLFEKHFPANDTERQLMALMANYKLNLMGSLRSTSDLMLSSERAGLLKRVALLNVIWLSARTAVPFHYFCAAPTSFLVAAQRVFTPGVA